MSEVVLCGNSSTGMTQSEDQKQLNLYAEDYKVLSIRNGLMVIYSRISRTKGSDTASASTLTLPLGGVLFEITGNADINYITTTGWSEGSALNLIVRDGFTFKHNTANPPAGTSPLKLSGNVDFVAAADATLSVIWNGSYWYEMGRKI